MVERNVPIGLTEDVCQLGKTFSRHCSIRNAYPAARFCIASKANLSPKNHYNPQKMIKYNVYIKNIVNLKGNFNKNIKNLVSGENHPGFSKNKYRRRKTIKYLACYKKIVTNAASKNHSHL